MAFFQKGFCLCKEKATKAFKEKLTVRQQKLEMPNRTKIFNENLIVSCRTTQPCGPGASYNPGSLYLAYHPLTEVTEKKTEFTVSIKAACDQPPSIPNLLCSSALFLLVTFCIYIVILLKHNKSDVPRELTICPQYLLYEVKQRLKFLSVPSK